MGTRLHGMARRAEEIELNRGRSRKNLVGGTEISDLSPSSAASGASLIFAGESHRLLAPQAEAGAAVPVGYIIRQRQSSAALSQMTAAMPSPLA